MSRAVRPALRDRIQLDPNEFVEQVVMPFAELLERVRSNQILDSKTILCALLSEKRV